MPELKVTAVADINPARLKAAKAAAEKAGQPIEGFPTAAALFESGLCDAVIIATPHYDHPPLVIEALAHNLHVITEKPAGVYTKQVREMNEAAAKSDKLFAVMFNQRTNHIYRKMKELVSSGRYGEIRRTNWIITDWFRCQSYYNSGGWRATWAGEGGGVLLNQCPHNLDLWQWICGMPAKVRAFCKEGHFHEIEVEDDVTAYVEYPNGATGVFISTTGEFPGTNRFEIVLDRRRSSVKTASSLFLSWRIPSSILSTPAQRASAGWMEALSILKQMVKIRSTMACCVPSRRLSCAASRSLRAARRESTA